MEKGVEMDLDELLHGEPIEIEVSRKHIYWATTNINLNQIQVYKFKHANKYGLAAYTEIVELPNYLFDPEHGELSIFCPIRGLNGVDSLSTNAEWNIVIGDLPYEFEGMSDGYIGVHSLHEAITDILDITWKFNLSREFVLFENQIHITEIK